MENNKDQQVYRTGSVKRTAVSKGTTKIGLIEIAKKLGLDLKCGSTG